MEHYPRNLDFLATMANVKDRKEFNHQANPTTSTSPLIDAGQELSPVLFGNLRIALTFAKTLLLFTRSDFPTVVVPWSVFGVATAYAGSPLTTGFVDRGVVLMNIPKVVAWMWLNVLAFNISNQRLPTSVSEDAINKAWRPLPSGRITVNQAKKLLLYIIPLVYSLTLLIGGREASMATMLLAWMYNDLGGADDHFVNRYILNALGMGAWGVGAAMVAFEGTQYTLTWKGYWWVALPGWISLATIHLMDLRDQEGDRAQNRSTLPLVYGDFTARILVIVTVMGSSVACLAMWPPSLLSSLPTLAIGCVISGRVMLKRTAAADDLSWKLWGPWLISIFVLPLMKIGV